MVDHRFALAVSLLSLSGCVVPPPGGPYGYPQPYPAPYVQSEYSYPGYAYNDGSPTLFVDGVTWPLVFYGGGWGYWDGYHRWHGAPPGVWHNLDQRHPGGAGYHPFGGGTWGRPSGPGIPGGSRTYGPPGGIRPAAGAPHPAGSRPAPARRDEHH